MSERRFTQREINRIVTARVNRERESLIKDFENRMKRCMASLHLMLHTEMCEMRREMTIPIQETLEVNVNDTKHSGTMSDRQIMEP